jgi:proliferating cell nuclear antigen
MVDIVDNISIDMLDTNILLLVYTKKCPAIKSLIEALKEIFRDVNIKFTPKKEIIMDDGSIKITGGMYITALNSNSNILVRLHLEADKFDYYKCVPENDKQYILIGVNMSNFNKIIKFLSNEDDLSMIYSKSQINELNLKYVNKSRHLVTNYHLNLLDLKEEIYNIGKQKFDFVITIPSNDFHGLIKNMSVLSEQVDIQFLSEAKTNVYTLTFTCKGEFASQTSEFNGMTNATESVSINSNMVNVLKNPNEEESIYAEDIIIQGKYELKSLSLFSKCSSLCSTIELYIKNDSPLVIKYRVADMGSVHLILSPVSEDNINGDSDQDSGSDIENPT